MMKQRWGLDRNVLRPTPGDPWGVEQHHWNTGAQENQQLMLSVNWLVFIFKYTRLGVRLNDGPDIKLFILVGWGRSFLSVAWSIGVQLLFFFCSSVPVVLFDTLGISRCQSQHVSAESSSLLHHSIYLWFICFPWWFIDELKNLHADRTTLCFEPW